MVSEFVENVDKAFWDGMKGNGITFLSQIISCRSRTNQEETFTVASYSFPLSILEK